MILSAIAAMARNRVIGINNKLPWKLPEDMKFFREKTKGSVMIMGRKTFESLPKPLPNRFHIVITRQEGYRFEDPLVEIVHDLNTAIELAHMLTTKYKNKFGEEVFVIGGSEIYRQAIDIVDRLYLTVIDRDYPGDSTFPEFSEMDLNLTKKDQRDGFSFCTYERPASPQ
ncbi:MAG: dihydrofolate reductase [Bdellovibrio sp. CG10_big_fil_rev_8_21_14_0_10_47_8]|nr:MAG: dihydrofolate reductase [Bdellovibrio sp. CG10_big_fil_rev_8_21_14_0_10_47_8]